jgi:general secretion pathway protein I
MSAMRSHKGFSLIEVLVAFVILSLVATALFRLFSGALGNAAAANDWSRAMLVAETQLTVAASTQPLREASDQGNDADGRLRWQTKVAPYDPPSTPDDIARASETMPTRLYRVSVDVHFPGDNGKERTISLSTLKIAQRNPP